MTKGKGRFIMVNFSVSTSLINFFQEFCVTENRRKHKSKIKTYHIVDNVLNTCSDVFAFFRTNQNVYCVDLASAEQLFHDNFLLKRKKKCMQKMGLGQYYVANYIYI